MIVRKFQIVKLFQSGNHKIGNEGGESYYPIVGDIIFFDWYDENGNKDGTSDHVGIVTRTDITNRAIYTIEGNTK